MEDGEQTVVQQEATVEETAPAEQETKAEETATTNVITREEFDKVVKGLQKVISRKDTEINTLQKSTQNDYSLKTLQRMAGIIEKTLTSGDYGNEETARVARAELKQINNDIRLAQVKTKEAQVNTIRDNLHSRIKEAGFDINDSKFRNVRAFFKQGLFDEASEEANEIIAKLEGENKVEVKKEEKKEEKPKVDEEEMRKKVRAEVEAEILKKYNLDKQDTTKAVGGGTGKKPTYEELHSSSPFETQQKVKSGEWVL